MAYGRCGNRPLGMENFWDEDLTMDISADEAYEKIRERILFLNPEAGEKDIKKFIG